MAARALTTPAESPSGRTKNREPAASEPAESKSASSARRTANPLLAVVGLCGGAGASTLSYLIARSAITGSERRVLVCDAGGATGGLAHYAGVESPRSLAGAANALSGAEPPAEGLFASDQRGLRVLAGGPDLETEVDGAGLARLIGDARAAHALTVIDCGTLRGATERRALASASHLAWVLPASESAIRRARRVLELIARDPARQEVLVARQASNERRAPIEALADLASARSAPLVLMPHVEELDGGDRDLALAAVEVTMEAILGVIRR